MRGIARVTFARKAFRRRANPLYQRLSFSQKGRFHRYFAKAFTAEPSSVEPGRWPVEFAGRAVTLPLRRERMWLDWDNALSIAGHDIEVKLTYAKCLRSANPPELFVDIGANYGMHSLLFLVHGIDVITFEPNADCHADFRMICAQNGVTPRIEGVALGELSGEVELVYPENETWLGTVQPTAALKPEQNLRVQRVPQRTLDDYWPEFGRRRMLLKADTEGNELQVLRGGLQTLEKSRPLIIFESFQGGDRRQLYELLTEKRYAVALLPWDPDRPSAFLDLPGFLASASENFIAVPRASGP